MKKQVGFVKREYGSWLRADTFKPWNNRQSFACKRGLGGSGSRSSSKNKVSLSHSFSFDCGIDHASGPDYVHALTPQQLRSSIMGKHNPTLEGRHGDEIIMHAVSAMGKIGGDDINEDRDLMHVTNVYR
ncbi:hypothetical protein REPUB_Repub04eG0205000 [Reevesia pubescens]